MIDNELIYKATQYEFNQKLEFDNIGLLATEVFGQKLLSFIEDKKYILSLNDNQSIVGVFCSQEIVDTNLLRDDIKAIVVDDPKWFFFSVVDYLGRNKIRQKTQIDDSTVVSPTAYISPVGVIIGKNCIIEPNVTIMQDVIIGDNVIVRAGAVIGVDGYEHKRTTRGVLSVVHDGQVVIENNVEIGVNTNVAKGFSYRETIVGENTKIDALVHYAHGVQCGKDCLIVANAMVGGNVSIGNRVWIGPSAVITNRIELEDDSFVTLGSVVTRKVKKDETVTGNFAIPHAKFLQNLKKMLSND